MFPSYDELPTAASLLMQCGYRSKVCTKARATKIDGSLHKLCEFHRRKANANQQRLHKRQREERVKRRRADAEDDRPMKRGCLADQYPSVDSITMDPIPYTAVDPPLEFDTCSEYYGYPSGFFGDALSPSVNCEPVDMELLELLLQDMRPLPAVMSPPNSPVSVDDVGYIIV